MLTIKQIENLNEDIKKICNAKGISIDLRWGNLGDSSYYYSIKGVKHIEKYNSYYAADIGDVKTLILAYIGHKWHYAAPNYKIGIYIQDIIERAYGYYDVVIGGCLFEDPYISNETDITQYTIIPENKDKKDANIVRCIPLEQINSFTTTQELTTDEYKKILNEYNFQFQGRDEYGHFVYIRKDLLPNYKEENEI